MNAVRINRSNWDRIVAQAEREFPFECCGLIIRNETAEDVRPITNIQNHKHDENPAAFPRDARTAYLMDPKGHLAVMKEIDERRLELKAVYHSHPDHDAYFSPTDRAQACSFDPDEPDYPGTVYLVLSIRDGKFARAAAFAWDANRKDFVATDLKIVERED